MTLRGATFLIVVATANIAFAQSKPQTIASGDVLWKKLEAQVDQIVQKFDGAMGIAIVDLTDEQAILKNADRVFPTASSIKIAILLELYRQEQEAREGDQGKTRLNDLYDFDPKVLVDFSSIMQGLTPGFTKVTNHDLAQFMIAVSDNTAANVLIDRVGMENVNATLRSLGLTKTILQRHMMDFEAAKRGNENVSTPREMTQLLESIYQGKVLNKELSAELIKQLSTLKESEIPHDLPEGVQIANKSGTLKGVRTDSGIVFAKNRPFAISVMTQNARDERDAERKISEITLDAYRYFEQHGRESKN